MKIYESFEKLDGTVVALGYFDGVHLGHESVISACVARARERGLPSCVVSFKFTSASLKPAAIETELRRIEELSQLGVDIFICPSFESFKSLTAQNYLTQILINQLAAAEIFCGENFVFGYKREGDASVLQIMAQKENIPVNIMPLVYHGGEPISSTRIRDAIKTGNIELANKLLGYCYSIKLPVKSAAVQNYIKDFHSVNQILPGYMQVPKEGIYATSVTISGTKYKTTSAIRKNMLFSEKENTVQTFINGLKEELYGQSPEIFFHSFLFDVSKGDKDEKKIIQDTAQLRLNFDY